MQHLHWIGSYASIAAYALMSLAMGNLSFAATPDQVDAALQKAKTSLYAKMDKDKFWEEVPARDEKDGGASTKGKQWGGLTSISVYALLAAGENHESPKLKPAIDWIKKQRIVGNYALGLRAQIWPFLPQTKDTQLLAIKDKDFLYRGLHRPSGKKGVDNDRLGFYPYWFNDQRNLPGDGWWDLSVSQYGVLGMWACEQVEGVEVPVDYWVDVDKAWKLAQYKDGPDAGAWAYQRGGKNVEHEKIKPTMTAAGIATLFITQDYILQYTNFAQCKGGITNASIDLGLTWMDKHINEMLGNGQFYGMYGIERIGVASGKKYFGTVDWYAQGSDYLVKSQAGDGSWGGSVPNTCFAVLFLSRGRAPVIMNKLEYSLNDPKNKAVKLPWEQRPRDVANFAKFATRQSENFFNWQVVNLKVAPDDLHDAPILYISGSKALDFTAVEVDKLREFVNAGGLILCNADCGDEEFVKSVAGADGLSKKLFPKYEFRELPEKHPIFTDEVYLAKNWKVRPKVLGISNGIRELMLLIPDADLGRSWQTRAEKTKEENFQLGSNIYFYASDKGTVRFRGDTHQVKPDPTVTPVIQLKIARLIVGDNPDPEPWGWKRMSAILLNTTKIGVTVEPIKLGEGKLGSATVFKIAHLTGTGGFKLNAAQQKELKTFTTAGGTLVIDAAGGSTGFADSAEQELAAIFGGDPAAVGPVVALDEPLYTWTGFKIARVEYRKFARNRLSGKLNAPRVRAIEIANKARVFYSREDLTGGMLGQPCDGILGYEPASATAIMRNIVLYAAYNGKAPRPATVPTTKPAAK